MKNKISSSVNIWLEIDLSTELNKLSQNFKIVVVKKKLIGTLSLFPLKPPESHCELYFDTP
jgi:hypothetical protein